MNPANIYLFKVNNGNTKTMCEICSKSTILATEPHQILTRTTSVCSSGVSILHFEQVNTGWDMTSEEIFLVTICVIATSFS